MADFTRSVIVAETTDLPTPETPLQELWRIFHKDRLAVIGLVVLMIEWWYYHRRTV